MEGQNPWSSQQTHSIGFDFSELQIQKCWKLSIFFFPPPVFPSGHLLSVQMDAVQ